MSGNPIFFEKSLSSSVWVPLASARLIADVTIHHAAGAGRVVYLSTSGDGTTGQASLFTGISVRLEGVDLSQVFCNSNFTTITLSVIGNSVP